VLRFLFGIALGIIVGAGGVLVWQELRRTEATPVSEVAKPPDAGVGPTKSGKRRRGGGSRTASAAPVDPDEPIPELSAADRMSRAEGDTLAAKPTSIDMGGEGVEPRDLDQGEIDAAFGARSGAIIDCITTARGNAPLSGRVTAGVVIGAEGKVVKTRVEAAAYLMDRGMGRCVRRVLSSLKFPATGREHVVTVPFDISE
jgi:hypothetical protein